MRVHGVLVPRAGGEKLKPEAAHDLLCCILSTEQPELHEAQRQLDFSYGVPGLARLRANVHFLELVR